MKKKWHEYRIREAGGFSFASNRLLFVMFGKVRYNLVTSYKIMKGGI